MASSRSFGIVRTLALAVYFGGWTLAGAWGLLAFGAYLGEVQPDGIFDPSGATSPVLSKSFIALAGVGAALGLLLARFLRDSYRGQLTFLLLGAGALALGLALSMEFLGAIELQNGRDIEVLVEDLLGTISLALALFGLLLALAQASGLVAKVSEPNGSAA